MLVRCPWANNSLAEQHYHDFEWGVPVHQDPKLFEFLILECAQAGLSWSTVLNKREAFRLAFDQFSVEKVAFYDNAKVNELLSNPAIIRNRLKIRSAINNAQAFIRVQQELGSFDHYIWQFVNYQTIQNQWRKNTELPSQSPLSQAISKDLKQRGFTFVGPTICYAFMQATGMVNDHTLDCFRHRTLLQNNPQ